MKWIVFILIIFSACKRNFEAPIPDLKWDKFESPNAVPLSKASRDNMEGVYTFSEGKGAFGDEAVLKWSYTVYGNDTTYHLSIFCEPQITLFIMEGKRLDSSILLNGYWRKKVNSETGIARLEIVWQQGASQLINGTPGTVPVIIIKGIYGTDKNLTLTYNRPLHRQQGFEILAHRGGGRTAELLPASENTVEIIKMASRLGANGIEIDVRLTKDGVPILFHDVTLNERTVQKSGILGPIENFTYAQLSSLIRLPRGEKIPTLRQALHAAVYETPLDFIWLDIKYVGSLEVVRDLQLEYIQRAAAQGRVIDIVIGIPDRLVMSQFLQLPNYENIPSINELTTEDVALSNSLVWAPRWTEGLLNEEVAAMQAQGRRAFVWTLDVPQNIRQYIYDSRFNGILSNYAPAVAFYYYAKK